MAVYLLVCVHLEIPSDLYTDDFIDVLVRFAGESGYQAHICSDKERNCVGAA